MPLQIISVNIHHHISVGRTTLIDPARPPAATGRTDVVFIQHRRNFIVLEEMSVSAEHMYIIVFQNLLQLGGVPDVAIGRNTVP